MKHTLIVILVAILTITIVLIVYRPELIEKIWLWIIGLIGPIIAFIKGGIQSIGRLFRSNNQPTE